MKKWRDNNVSDALWAFGDQFIFHFYYNWRIHSNSISASPNSWTDGGIVLEWLKVCFDAQTREKAAGAPWVLLMDGHSSHYTPELLEYARDNNIIILGYHPTALTHYKVLMLYVLQGWRKPGRKRFLSLKIYTKAKWQRETLLKCLGTHFTRHLQCPPYLQPSGRPESILTTPMSLPPEWWRKVSISNWLAQSLCPPPSMPLWQPSTLIAILLLTWILIISMPHPTLLLCGSPWQSQPLPQPPHAFCNP